MAQDFKKIAIWQTAFLGDTVLTLPFIEAVSNKFVNAEIHLFVRKGVESLFEYQKNITSVVGFDKRGKQKNIFAARELGKKLGKEGFDLFISAHTSLRSALIAQSSKIETRVGYDSPWYNKVVYTKTVARKFDQLEEIERIMQLGKPLGIDEKPPKATLSLSDEAVNEANLFFKGISKPVVGIHPGSTWETKKWPEENFSSLINKCCEKGLQVIVFGGPDEVDLCNRLIGSNSKDVINLSGKLGLQSLAAYIKNVDVYVTNDSGPMHIAWIQDVPVVAMFGPTIKEFGFFPRGQKSIVLEAGADLKCRPCGLHGGKKCPEGHHRCMTEISVAAVFSEVLFRV